MLNNEASNRICARCNLEIGHERHLRRMGAVWHPECFRCHACGLRIFDLEFSVSGNRPYHESCYKDQNHPRCNVCKNFVSVNPKAGQYNFIFCKS
ncbi:Protein DA1-related 1 [Vitis vinifera]|uniref:Protein DA1-related 1 n=1 Tax=Vitis vinifera TaxID=29760 RepID=A0A438GM45_VITVI|nr:Protein DA1-related 1 [Vitis vinifera]